MAEFPALPLWTDAYLADTGHLTVTEHGAYLLLLMTMWRNGGSLPNDDKKLARYSRCTKGQWQRIRPTIMEFFTIENEQLFQGRLTDTLAAVRQRSKQQSDNARSKYRKTKKTYPATAEPTPPTSSPTKTKLKTKEEDTVTSVTVVNGCAVDAPKPKRYPVQEAFDLYNMVAKDLDLPIAMKLTPERRRSLGARLKEHTLDGWKHALSQLIDSPHLLGNNDRTWRADLDFLLQPSKLNRVIEGFYIDKGTIQ